MGVCKENAGVVTSNVLRFGVAGVALEAVAGQWDL